MKKVIGYLIIPFVLAIGAGVVYYTMKAYFMVRVGETALYDGWGRKLYEPPVWMNFIWSDVQFPGYKWLLIDIIGFWVVAGLCGGLIKLSAYLRNVE